MKFETARIHFLGDVFAIVAVTVVLGACFEGEGRACRPLTRDRSSCATYFLRGWGPFLESPGNLTGPESYF